MAGIGLTWELGAASGYAAVMRQIVMAAARKGHRCVAMVRDLHASAPLLGELPGVTILQAPIATASRTPPVRVQTSYTTLLHNCGFADSDALAARVKAWQALYHAFELTHLLAQHSPTAVLAARAMGVPVTLYGTGFSIPPACSPWPSFHPDMRSDDPRLASNEDRVLATTNATLRQLGAPPLSRMADLFADLPTAVLGYRELDPYPRAETQTYLGLPMTSYGAAPVWPVAPARPRLFASLLADNSARDWVNLIAQLPVSTLLRFNGHPLQITELPSHVVVAEGAVDFAQAISECDAVVGYGSHNLVCEALLAGKPAAVIANNPDQLLTAQRAVALGAGLVLGTKPGNEDLGRLRAWLDDPLPLANAQRFAHRHASQPRDRIADTLLQMALPG